MLRLYLKGQLVQILRDTKLPRFSTNVAEATDTDVLVEDEFKAAKEAEIDLKRNKSRLTQHHFSLIHNQPAYPQPLIRAHQTVKYNRKLYGKYGNSSGVDPGLCWPTKTELTEAKEYERVAYPYTIQQVVEQCRQQKKLEAEKIIKREEDITAKLAKLDQWRKDLQARLDKKTSDALAAKAKKDRLIDEVRRHFGFKLDPKDERFQEMLAKREKEQKKLEKQAKREAKEKLMLVKLQQKNAELVEKSKVKTE